LWIAFGFGVIVGVFCMWKCCSRVDHSKEAHPNVKHWSNAEKQQTLKKKDSTVAYLPLGNFNQKFMENKIDDQNIHVRLFLIVK